LIFVKLIDRIDLCRQTHDWPIQNNSCTKLFWEFIIKNIRFQQEPNKYIVCGQYINSLKEKKQWIRKWKSKYLASSYFLHCLPHPLILEVEYVEMAWTYSHQQATKSYPPWQIQHAGIIYSNDWVKKNHNKIESPFYITKNDEMV